MAAALANLNSCKKLTKKKLLDCENPTVDRLLVLLFLKKKLCHMFTEDEKCWKKLFSLGHSAAAIEREVSGIFSEDLVQGTRQH